MMQKPYIVLFLFLAGLIQIKGQHAPAAGIEGSTAIHKDSTIFSGWATSCTVIRGYIKLSDTSFTYEGSNKATIGSPENVTGKADGSIISLGDSGVAIVSFEKPIGNGPGPDFAVFENGFQEQVPPQLYFLELAVVEVSSDGENFVRFPAISNTPIYPQVATFGQLNPEHLYNLAGKYVVNYGTPFDLEELKDSVGLDINSITHVKIIDVVGSILSGMATLDSEGVPINDPFPTPFNSGGFDLDAVGVIHHQGDYPSANPSYEKVPYVLYPNPVTNSGHITIQLESHSSDTHCLVSIVSLSGQPVYQQEYRAQTKLQLTIPAGLDNGIYLVQIQMPDRIWSEQLIITR